MAGIRRWKELRIFISSTFRDMHAERDYLVRFVFPRLRQELLRHRVHLLDIDLRWGVTADQDAFDLCMHRIDQCRPRFVCLLGGRYGWVPAPRRLPAQLIETLKAGKSAAGELSPLEVDALNCFYLLEEQSRDYCLKQKPLRTEDVKDWEAGTALLLNLFERAALAELRSITEAEVRYGVLDGLGQPGHSFFYFRDPASTATIPDEFASDYREAPGSFAAQALEALKQEISTSPLVTCAPFIYDCSWDNKTRRIAGLEEWGERVYGDLLGSLESELGPAEALPPGEFAEEEAAQESFIEGCVSQYVIGSRQPVFDQLEAYIDGSDPGRCLCLVGGAGTGKSALLAWLIRNYSPKPALPGQGETLVLSHFTGAGSSNLRLILRRLCVRLLEAAGIDLELPLEYDDLRGVFFDLLAKVGEQRRLVLCVDAVNQMDAAYQAQQMKWLPEILPQGVRIILSCPPCPALESLRARRLPPEELALPALASSDQEAILQTWLAEYGKRLDREQQGLLQAKQDVDNPLYLLTSLEELRTLGTYEEITSRIKELPERVKELFTWILARLERDLIFRQGDRLVGMRLVPAYCRFLGAARPGTGMSQSELVELVCPADPQGNLAALQRLLLPYLMRRGELLDFSHAQVREAVEDRYFKRATFRRKSHERLAAYFDAQPLQLDQNGRQLPNLRKLSEQAYQQAEAGLREAWLSTLTEFPFIEAKLAALGPQLLLEDYDLMDLPADEPTCLYRQFLRKHAQRLQRYPEAFFSLVYREGFPAVRAEALALLEAGGRKLPWLKAEPAWMPATSQSGRMGMGVEILARWEFGLSAASSLAAHARLAFHIKGAGQVGMVDLKQGHGLPEALSIRPGRPLGLFCSPDGVYLAVAYEDGCLEVYELAMEAGKPSGGSRHLASLSYLIPEFDAPWMEFSREHLWYQDAKGDLSRFSLDEPGAQPFHYAVELPPQAELSSIVALEGCMAATLRNGPRTVLALLEMRGGQLLQEVLEADVLCACALAGGLLALVLTDGRLLALDLQKGTRQECVLEDRPTCIADTAEGLACITGNGRISLWEPEHAQPPRYIQTIQDAAFVGAQRMVAVNGSIYVVGRIAAAAFCWRDQLLIHPAHLNAVFPGPKGGEYRALQARRDGIWLLDSRSHEERWVEGWKTGSAPPGLSWFPSAMDGREQILYDRSGGAGILIEATEVKARQVRLPARLTTLAGRAEGGFWAQDSAGSIYLYDPENGCRQMALSSEKIMGQPHLQVWPGLLVSLTSLMRETAEGSSMFYGMALLSPQADGELLVLGSRFFGAPEGEPQAIAYDASHDRLFVCLRRQLSVWIRVGSPQEFAACLESEFPLAGSEQGLRAAALTPEGDGLFLLSSSGDVLYFETHGFERQAVLTGSLPLSDISSSPLPGGPVLVVEDHTTILACSLVGGEK